jgi:hypothetical protein
MTTTLTDQFDSPWKDILEAYFEDFMRFFFPKIHADIDWSRGYDFLDQELRQVVLASLAILGDDRETWRPGPFETDLWGCRAKFEFPTIKLLDYESRWSELEASDNPFAIAVMAHLKTKATRQDLQSRKEWKFRLTRQLYEQGYERQDILNLFKFLDWIMELPQELKQAFRTELEQYEQERQMPYITSIEQMAKEEMAVKMLQENISVEIISRVTGRSPEALRQLQASPGN